MYSCMGPSTREVSAIAQAAVPSSIPEGPQDPEDPMRLEASMEDAIWSLFQALVGESQPGPLGF